MQYMDQIESKRLSARNIMENEELLTTDAVEIFIE